MKTLKFRVTATISKVETVEVDDENLTDDEVEEIGRQQAHEQFNCLNDGTEEKYTEDSKVLDDNED